MKITAEKRKVLGKKVKTLRRGGFIPAVVYGGDKEPQVLSIKTTDFNRAYQEAGESSLIDLEVGEASEKALITAVQRDPVNDAIIHADFKRIVVGEKMTATVPIQRVGEPPLAKSGEGVLLELLTELKVECLPEDIPHEITLDVSKLDQVGAEIKISDLPLDFSKVKVLEHEPEEAVVRIGEPMKEEVEAVPVSEAEAVAAVEATQEKKEEEAEGKETVAKGEPRQGREEGASKVSKDSKASDRLA